MSKSFSREMYLKFALEKLKNKLLPTRCDLCLKSLLSAQHFFAMIVKEVYPSSLKPVFAALNHSRIQAPVLTAKKILPALTDVWHFAAINIQFPRQ